LTQLGFIRIVSNPAFSRDALSPIEALALLGEILRIRLMTSGPITFHFPPL